MSVFTGSDWNNGTFIMPFKTIQKAANVMSVGVRYPQTYIFPGTCKEIITISSNLDTNMLFTKLSNTSPVVYGSSMTKLCV